MKICVSAVADALDAQVDPRFGRCAYFVMVDSDTMQFDAVPNTAAGTTGGAGIQAAQLIVNKGATVVVTGNVGPNAFQALSASEVKVVVGAQGTVRQAVEEYKNGKLRNIRAPTVRGHFGQGRGTGRGRGRGRRR